MKTFKEFIDEALPPHLQKHFDSSGDKKDGKWVKKNGKRVWVPNKKKFKKAKDVTPKGYGPE